MTLQEGLVAASVCYFLFILGVTIIENLIYTVIPNEREIFRSELYMCVEKGECEAMDSYLHTWRERVMWYFLKNEGRVATYVGLFIGTFLLISVELPVNILKRIWLTSTTS